MKKKVYNTPNIQVSEMMAMGFICGGSPVVVGLGGGGTETIGGGEGPGGTPLGD